LTIAHVSDIHIGRFTRTGMLPAIADATNKLRADLVVMSGDLIDIALSDLPAGIDFLRKLDPRHGLFVIEGNHDLIESAYAFESKMIQSGMPLLVDETATVTVRGRAVQMLGMSWGRGDAHHVGAMSRLIPQRRAGCVPDPSRAPPARVRPRRRRRHPAHPFGPHARRTAHAQRAIGRRAGYVPLLVGTLSKEGFRAVREQRRRELVPAAHQRTGGDRAADAARYSDVIRSRRVEHIDHHAILQCCRFVFDISGDDETVARGDLEALRVEDESEPARERT
jgi:hypothetical protein